MSIEIYVAHVVEEEANLTIFYNGRWLQINGAGTDWTAPARRTTPRRWSSRSSTGSRRSSSPRCRSTPSPTSASAWAPRTAIPAASAATSSPPSPASSAAEAGPTRASLRSRGFCSAAPTGRARTTRGSSACRPHRRGCHPAASAAGTAGASRPTARRRTRSGSAYRLQQRLAMVRAGVAARAEQPAGVPDEPLAGHRVDELAERSSASRRRCSCASRRRGAFPQMSQRNQ